MNVTEFYGSLPDHTAHQSIKANDALVVLDETLPIDSELFIRRLYEINAEKGYELLFKRYYNPLCSHASRFVYSTELAEDIVVDVFSQFWQKQQHRSVTTSYRAYLFTSVRHAAFAHLRAEFGRQLPGDHSVDTETPPTPQQLLQYNELYLRIESIIRSESPQSQRVFILSRFEGKKNSTIAEELGLSVKTVEGHITKVLSILRRSLRDSGFLAILLSTNFWFAGQGVKSFFLLVRIAINDCL